jgi:hypothetical protein
MDSWMVPTALPKKPDESVVGTLLLIGPGIASIGVSNAENSMGPPAQCSLARGIFSCSTRFVTSAVKASGTGAGTSIGASLARSTGSATGIGWLTGTSFPCMIWIGALDSYGGAEGRKTAMATGAPAWTGVPTGPGTTPCGLASMSARTAPPARTTEGAV